MLTGVPADGAGLAWMLLGVPVTMTGLVLAALAIGARLATRSARAEVAERGPTLAPDLFDARLTRLRPLLLADRSDMTFEKLAKESGMTEAALVETLALAESRSLVDEELNLETGQWYYRLGLRGKHDVVVERPRSLEERKRELESRRDGAPG